MALLENHLEQISLSATSIAELQFPAPKIFTNALLGNHEITTLIRDTEPHERALFSINPNAVSEVHSQGNRRHRAFLGAETAVSGRKSLFPNPDFRKQSAVARVLGTDILQEIQHSSINNARSRGLNVEILLKGAEKLCAVYPVQGAPEKIASLRNRHKQISESIVHYEEKVAKQQARLDRVNKSSDYGARYTEEEENGNTASAGAVVSVLTEHDIQAEEHEIRELEVKKRALEERVAGMERDLGGLLSPRKKGEQGNNEPRVILEIDAWNAKMAWSTYIKKKGNRRHNHLIEFPSSIKTVEVKSSNLSNEMDPSFLLMSTHKLRRRYLGVRTYLEAFNALLLSKRKEFSSGVGVTSHNASTGEVIELCEEDGGKLVEKSDGWPSRRK